MVVRVLVRGGRRVAVQINNEHLASIRHICNNNNRIYYTPFRMDGCNQSHSFDVFILDGEGIGKQVGRKKRNFL
jgi:hypothetical protein